MAEKRLNEYRLKVGDSVIGLICPTADYAQSLEDYFGEKNVEQKADLTLTLNLIPHEVPLEIPDSLFNTKTVTGEKFIMGDELVSGTISKKSNTGELNVKLGLTHGQVTRVFEQILYQAFYSACKIKNSDSILIHSSGVIYKNHAFLFVGTSGSGKSTVAELSREHTVLNDEICLIQFQNDSISLQSTPFNGYFKEKRRGAAALSGIFLLSHGPEHMIKNIKKSSAIKQVAMEIVPPTALDEEIKQDIVIEMFDIAGKIYDMVPVRILDFKPDSGFWDVIDKEFIQGKEL